MSAVELASAYISLVPSASGIREAIAKEFDGLDTAAKKEGDKAGKAFGSSMADRVKDLAAGAGVAASAALSAGFVNSLGIEKGTDKLTAQLGLTGPASKAAGKTAGDLYSGAYGDSLEEVNQAVKATAEKVTGASAIGTEAFKTVTASVLDLADALEVDVGQAAGAVGALVKSGLAKDATEATDLLAKGLQVGANRGGDLVDTLTKSSTNLKQFGLTGEQAVSIFNQALDAGAPSADSFTGALEELIGNAGDSADVFTSIGLNGAQMARDLSGGGPAAAAALDTLLDRLRTIEDPAARSTALVSLFGEEATALQSAILAVDPSKAVDGLGDFAGTAAQMGTTLADNTGGKIDSFKRKFELMTAGVGGAVGPLGAILPAAGGLVTTFGALDGVTGKITSGLGSAVSAIGSGASKAGELARGLGSAAVSGAQFAATQATAAVNVARTTGALVAQKVAATAQAVATKAAAVAQGIFNAVMALNPIFLIVLAVVAFVAILVLAYTKVEWFRNFVDAAFRLVLSVVQSVVGWVRDNWPLLLAILTGPIGLAVLVITKNWDKIKAGFTAVKDWIFEKVGNIVGFITGIPGRVAGGLSSLWRMFTEGAAIARNWVVDKLNDVVGFVSGLPGRIGNAARGMWDSLSGGFRAALNFIIRGWNGLDFRIPGFSVGPVSFGGFTLGLPDIPSLAQGGIVKAKPGGTIVRVAEAGQDEEIRPLPRGGGDPGMPPIQQNIYAGPGQDERLIGNIAGRRLGFELRTAPA